MPKLVAALLAVVLAALALAACGSEDSGTTNSTSGSGSATSPSGQPSREKLEQKREESRSGKQSESKGSKGSDSANQTPSPAAKKAAASVPPLKVSGGGSAQYRTKGGDNSIQEFGEEGDEGELREAAEALHGFYLARAGEEWDRACSYLASSLVKQFEALAGRTPQLKDAGCPEVLHAFTRPLPPSVVRDTSRIDAVSLRREGERSFLLYLGEEEKVYAIPMSQEDGAWKVGGLAGTPIN